MILNINVSKEVRENQLFDSELINIIALKNAVIKGSPILITSNEESSEDVHSLRIDIENEIDEEQLNILKDGIINQVRGFFIIANIRVKLLGNRNIVKVIT